MALILVTSASGARAQQTNSQSEGAEAAGLEEIVVTASRIKQSGFTAPTPTTVIGGHALDNRAAVNIADALNELPAMGGSVTPETSTISTTSVGGNFLNLRGLGIARTLVLVNGRRHVPTLPFSNAVDLNVIPTSLVERVEVVTGGASAAWGSDAVAGVVNLIIDDDFEGIRGEAQVGRSARGDNEEYKASFAVGSGFLGQRGHIVLAVEKAKSEGVVQQSSRDWAKEWGTIANPEYASGTGEYRLMPVPHAHLSIASAGGLIVSGPLAGTQFLPGGVPVAFDYGTLRSAFSMSDGDGLNFGSDLSLRVPLERWSAFSAISFDVTDHLQLYLEPSFARSHSVNPLVQSYSLGTTTIQRDNAFLPESIRERMIDLNLDSFQLGRIDNDAPFITVDVETETKRLIGGVRGALGGWNWDASAQYGESRYVNLILNNRIAANYALAVDAVLDPVTGRIVCRSTLSDPGNGCVPMNLFGSGSLTAAAIDYTTADQRLDTTFTEESIELSASGPMFDLPAGTVSAAVGAVYRGDEQRAVADPISLANGFIISNLKPVNGDTDVREIFAEVLVPVVESVELNGAVRYTDYSVSGSVRSWKMGVSYDLLDGIRVRATRSHDIRAPHLTELFGGDRLLFTTVLDPFRNGEATFTRVITGANPELEPETGDTTTFGIVYQPAGMDGFRASVDYFNIHVKDAISSLSASNIVDRCFNGADDLCELITRNPDGSLFEVNARQLNLSELIRRGVDLEMVYQADVGELMSSWEGNLTLRALATYLDKFETFDGVVRQDFAGQTGSGAAARWKANVSGSYVNGPLTIHLAARYVGDGKYNVTFDEFDYPDKTVPSRTYFDATVTYAMLAASDRRLEIFGRVENMLDTDPPIAPSTFVQHVATNAVLFDVVGRHFTMGMRFEF